jgi:hypothetical protein
VIVLDEATSSLDPGTNATSSVDRADGLQLAARPQDEPRGERV